jgi:hypothetical protein
MVNDYGIDPATIFYIWRPILSEKIRQYDADLAAQVRKQKLLKDLGDKSTENEDSVSPAPSGNSEAQDGKTVESTTSTPHKANGDPVPQKSEEYAPTFRLRTV